MVSTISQKQNIAIVGAGAIGLTCAFELHSRGHAVTVFDAGDIASTSSWAAAGMIAPAYELMLQGVEPDEVLAELCFESAHLWKAFAERIRRATGAPVGYSHKPTLAVARNAQEQGRLEKLRSRLAEDGRAAMWLSARRLHGEFGVSNAACEGLLLPDDHQVDNRRLLTSLRAWLTDMDMPVRRQPVDTARDVQGFAGPEGFDAIVWARGNSERGTPHQVKGQALALHPVSGGPQQVVRFGTGYAVPKPDRIVIGATNEFDFASLDVEPGTVSALLEAAVAVLPSLAGARVMEHWSGLRPKGQSERPVIGKRSKADYVATAHYRNGILLAPATAQLIADQIEGHRIEPKWGAFAPSQRDLTAN
jgi:glycine oxidase ThiO